MKHQGDLLNRCCAVRRGLLLLLFTVDRQFRGERESPDSAQLYSQKFCFIDRDNAEFDLKYIHDLII